MNDDIKDNLNDNDSKLNGKVSQRKTIFEVKLSKPQVVHNRQSVFSAKPSPQIGEKMKMFASSSDSQSKLIKCNPT